MAGPHLSGAHPRRQWHRLVEHYTPDGGLGRFLFAIASGSAAGFAALAGVFGISVAGLLPTFLGLVALGASLGAALLTVVALWPVYLSLIGNVESAAAYADASPPFPSALEDDDPVAVLQHRYAVGEVSREEFERRLDDLLQVDVLLDSHEGSASASSDEPDEVREPARH